MRLPGSIGMPMRAIREPSSESGRARRIMSRRRGMASESASAFPIATRSPDLELELDGLAVNAGLSLTMLMTLSPPPEAVETSTGTPVESSTLAPRTARALPKTHARRNETNLGRLARTPVRRCRFRRHRFRRHRFRWCPFRRRVAPLQQQNPRAAWRRGVSGLFPCSERCVESGFARATLLTLASLADDPARSHPRPGRVRGRGGRDRDAAPRHARGAAPAPDPPARAHLVRLPGGGAHPV